MIDQRLPNTPNRPPELVIMDMSWLDYECPKNIDFYQRFPPRDIVEVITRIPTTEDYDTILWEQVEARYENPEELNTLDLDAFAAMVESVVDLFYRKLIELTHDTSAQYRFRAWVDKNTIAMIRDRSTEC